MRIDKFLHALLIALTAFGCATDSNVNPTGQGGSMTRFAVSGSYLYLVDDASIKTFNIADGGFEQVNKEPMDFGAETIFANGSFLYLGANDAMYIYSIAEPATPSFVFRYQHIVSCDPVVVQGARAYVTMRGGNACNQGTNALEIIDISNPDSPVLVRNYPMSSPHGLGIDNNLLFLCEGEHGLKVFDVSNERDMKLVQHRDDFYAYDVIVKQGVATVTGEDGIFQFSYAAPNNEITLVSTIPVTRTP
jgi:hypothetical protein